MRVETIKMNITFSLPYDHPDGNGHIFTEECVENSIKNLKTELPIVINKNIIGKTGKECIVIWDFENKVCKVTFLDCILYHGGFISQVKVENNKITQMDITSLGISID